MRELLKQCRPLVLLVKKVRKICAPRHMPRIERDLFKDLRNLMSSIDIKSPTFIDGGAHNGSTILKIRDEGFTASPIYAFEPIPYAAEALVRLADKNTVIFAQALSDKDGSVSFNVNKKGVTSSILEPDLAKKYHPQLTDLSNKITVPTVRLDTLLKDKTITQPDIIKLDLQGSELWALQGAVETLKHTKIVYTEVEFVTIYKEQPLFHNVSIFLQKNGFSLFNLYNCGDHTDGQLLAGDALFLNDSYYKK